MKKHAFSVLILLFALLLPAVFASAASGEAQLAVFCKTEDRAIAHARISLYLIGAVEDSTLVPEAPYNAVTLPVVQASSAQAEIAVAAQALQAYINEKNLPPDATAYTDAQGKAQFDALEVGAYLVLADFSETADAKDASALPALVFVLPRAEGESKPTEVILKIEEPPETTTVPTTPTTPGTPTTPTTPTTPQKPTEPTSPEHPGEPTTTRTPEERLPYTGQLWWPVPVLAAAGLFFFVCGFRARRQKQETER